MMPQETTATQALRALLGAGATDDAIWGDMARFEAAALPVIDLVWALNTAEQNVDWQAIHPHEERAQQRYSERMIEATARIWAALGGETSRCAAAFYLHPQLWRPRYGALRYGNAHHFRARAEEHLIGALSTLCVENPPPDWAARLCQRLLTVCSAVSSGGSPEFGECVGHLLRCDEPQVGALLDALTAGKGEEAWWSAVTLAGMSHPFAADRLRAAWQQCGAQHAVGLLYRLHRQGKLDERAFLTLVETVHGGLRRVNDTLAHYAAHPPTDALHRAFAARLQRLADAALWPMLGDFRPERLPTLLEVTRLSGGRYLLRLAEEVERQGLSSLDGGGYKSTAYVLRHLLGALQRRPDEDSAALTALLRQISAPTLLAILPHAQPYEAEICAALGCPGATALLALLHRLEQRDPAHATDPAAGVLHRRAALDALAALDAAQTGALLAAFAPHRKGAVTLLRAALGENRTEIRRLLGRRNQLAARAFGLLPLDKPDEVLQRYLLLTRYERDSNSSGAGKKAYERAAAQAGLTNLALNAGYADATRLEWAMQDRLGAETVALGRQWQIEGYTLTLTLHAPGPALAIRNAKRALKRTPSAVTRDYAYREVRATLEQAQDQERRLRQAFLDALCRAAPLTPDELTLLRRNPLATHLLERLVLCDEAGACGLFCAHDGALEGTHGERVRISGAVRIAHPYTLAQAGLLGDWQAEIVRRQIVQPFKQVFRELYVLTPAEQEAIYASGRLAGRRLRGRQALAVLAQIGWQVEYGTVARPFHSLGYAAHFETGSSFEYGYDDPDDRATTGRLQFYPLVYDATPGEHRIALADVPPLVFSEVLRDLDLVTAIAHASDEHGTSREVLRGRGDLARATAAALGLAQVTVAEPYVQVRGALTSYRIHLATGAVYTAAGQYVCIVPGPKEQQAVYLPFAERGEPLASEIISKMLLLANDRQISDPTILRQLAPARAAA